MNSCTSLFIGRQVGRQVGRNRVSHFCKSRLPTFQKVCGGHSAPTTPPVVDVIKLFLEELQKISISPLAETARIGHFKRKKIVLGYSFASKSIVLTFLCRYRHQNKCYSISSLWGNHDFIQNKFYNIDYCQTFVKVFLPSIDHVEVHQKLFAKSCTWVQLAQISLYTHRESMLKHMHLHTLYRQIQTDFYRLQV